MSALELSKFADDGALKEPADIKFIRRRLWDGEAPFSFAGVSVVTREVLDVLFEGLEDRAEALACDLSSGVARTFEEWRGGSPAAEGDYGTLKDSGVIEAPSLSGDAQRYTPYRLAERLKQRLSGLLQADYPLANPTLIESRRILLEDQETKLIAQEPYVESTPQYVQHEGSFGNLGLSPEAAEFFSTLAGTPRDFEPKSTLLWPGLYRHQAQALSGYGVDRKSLVVSTGTGSGKTECFLLPLVHQLFEEARLSPASFQKRGLRAIVLYPMNALVNDQMSRLRLLVGSVSFAKLFKRYTGQERHPTFGCYTGRTPYPGPRSASRDGEDVGRLLEHYLGLEPDIRERLQKLGRLPAKDLEQFYGGDKRTSTVRDDKVRNRHNWDKRLVTSPEDREYLTRHEMLPEGDHGHGEVPDILVTNYSMLEYMLTRPWERPIFAKSGKRLEESSSELLLVLDEAHMYRGSRGAEVGLLVRRLAHRLGLASGSEKLRVICTSASLGSADRAQAVGKEFAADLTGKAPEDFVVVSSQQVSFGKESSASPSDEDVVALGKVDLREVHDAENVSTLCFALSSLLNSLGLQESYPSEDELWAALYVALKSKWYVHNLLQETSGRATPFSALSERVFGQKGLDQTVSTLLTLGTLSRPTSDAAGLIPARVHLMFRGLNGLYACINPRCQGRQHYPGEEAPCGRLYSEPRAHCHHCESRVLELLSCQNCGSAFFQAYHSEENPHTLEYLWGESEEGAYPIELAPCDLPEAGLVMADPISVDLRSGFVGADAANGCSETVVQMHLPRKDDGREAKFSRCPYCEVNDSRGTSSIRSFRSAGEGPFTTLLETQFAEQPPTNPGTPNKGRKVLVFSDGRQKAARLAPALEGHHLSTAFRQAAVLGLEFAQQQLGTEEVRADFLFPAMMKLCAQRALPLFPEDEHFRVAVNRVRNLDLQSARTYLDAFQDFGKALRFHLCHRFNSLHALALVKVCWSGANASVLDSLPLPLGPAERRIFADLWLKSLLEGRRFLPKGVSLQQFSINDRPQGIELRRETDLLSQRFQRFITNLFGESELRGVHAWAKELLANSGLFLLLDDRYFVCESMIGLQPMVGHRWFACQGCGKLYAVHLRGCCPSCLGRIAPVQDDYLRARTGFFRDQISRAVGEGASEPFGLITAEHSAQLAGNEFGNDPHTRTEIAEMRFQDIPVRDGSEAPLPPVDILSCTTTMEVGIDIGNLTGVALRNVPPGVANYQQRAGRAGRRGRALASVLTYAHGNTHDEHYFRNPAEIITGTVPEPSVYIDNQRIMERHINAEILRLYFDNHLTGKNSPALFTSLGKVEDFLGDSAPSLRSFSQWCDAEGSRIQAELLSWLPKESHHRGTSIPVEAAVQDACRNLINRLKGELPLDAYKQREELGTADREALEYVLGEDLLKFLIDLAILPRYAFPTDVVSFWVPSFKREGKRATFDYSPQRDLKVALSEYAPGAAITLNKLKFVSSGFYSPYDPDSRALLEKCEFYFSCDRCGFVATRPIEDEMSCPCCDSSLKSTPMIRPKGFTHDVKTRGDKDGGGEVLRAGHTTPAKLEVGEVARWDAALFEGRLSLLTRSQNLVVVNKGVERKGFNVCPDCGRAEPYTPRKGRRRDLADDRKHTHPVDGSPCAGRSVGPYLIGHKFPTDVLLARLSFQPPFQCSIFSEAEAAGRAGLTSLVEALCLVASRELQIDEGELSGNWAPVVGSKGQLADIFFYDELPGGAGYAVMFGANLERVMRETLKALEACNCDKSCYGCIRHYRNRMVHGSLDRKLAIDLLKYLLDGELPIVDAQAGRDLEALAAQSFTGATVEPAIGDRYRLISPGGEIDVTIRHPFIVPSGASSELQLSSYLLKAAPPTAWREIQRRMPSLED